MGKERADVEISEETWADVVSRPSQSGVAIGAGRVLSYHEGVVVTVWTGSIWHHALPVWWFRDISASIKR